MEKSEIIKSGIPLAVPFVNAVVETFFKPKIAELAKKLKLSGRNIENVLQTRFDEYLTRSYERNSILNTIVFNNQQKLLKKIYVPLEVQSKTNKDQKFVIDKYDDSFIPEFQRVLITDTAV